MKIKLWPLHLVIPGRFGRLLTGVLILSIFLGIVGLLGGLDPEKDQYSSLLFFCCLFTYMIPCFHYIIENSVDVVNELRPVMGLNEQEFSSLRESMQRKSALKVFVPLAAGALIGGLQSYIIFSNEVGSAAILSALDSIDMLTITSTVFTWCLMTTIVFALIDNALRFFNIAGKLVTIDLLDPQRLTPLARIAVISTLSIIGALALFPVMLLEGEANLLAIVPGVVALLIPMFWLFFLPIWPAHKRIKAAKQVQLAIVQAQINELRAASGESRQLIRDLQPMFVYRNEIANVSEWPFDSVAIARLMLYLIIPPLTWVGAALIEILVDSLV